MRRYNWFRVGNRHVLGMGALIKFGQVATVTELARTLKFSFRYTKRILSLVNLSPAVVEAIVYGREPDGLSLQKLVNGFPDDFE